MIISRLSLENFRNYKNETFDFYPGVNVLFGNNGQGKTNVIEAVFLCAIGGSFRTSHTTELIKYDEQSFSVNLKLENDIRDSVSYFCDRQNKKAIKVDGIYLQKIGELMGCLHAVLFSPEDLQLITEGPSVRRRFLDIALSQQKPSYFYDLSRYNKIIAQKSALIREIRYGHGGSDKLKQMEIWNGQLAMCGAPVILERIRFINKLSKFAADAHGDFTGEKEVLSMNYDTFLEGENSEDIMCFTEEEIREKLITCLETNVNREIEREACIIGPHRDDVIFKINGYDLKKYGSQGQKRTAVLALKMGELDILTTDTGRAPVLLLDDVLSELDAARSRILLKWAGKVQTFITCTDRKKVRLKDSECGFFNIKDGSLKR